MMRILLLFILPFTLAFPQLNAQNLYFPPTSGNNWDTIAPSNLGWCPQRIDSLYSYLDLNNTKAFIVLKDGKIVLEKYFGTFQKDSLWYWASAGKTLTSLLVGIAQQENYLKISDSTYKYLGNGWTNLPANKEKAITIKHQLSMTSGLDDAVTDPYCTIDSCLKYKADAGTRWAYHNAPYTLLDKVITSATGSNLNAYFNAKVKNQTGMTGFFIPSGFNNVFVSDARSMARFGLLILNKGKWNATPVLNDTNYYNQMVNTSQNLNLSYGYLWWLNGKTSAMVPGSQVVFPFSLFPNAPSDMFTAIGKNGQIMNVAPSQNLVVLRMGDSPNGGDNSLALNDTIWQKMNRLICNPGAVSELNSELRVFPNPFQSKIQLSNYQSGTLYKLSNSNGSMIYLGNDIESHDFSYLQNGIYLLQVIRKNAVGHYKLIKN